MTFVTGRTSALALFGGEPEAADAPAFVWPPIAEEDAQLVAEMTRRGELSYYGREGQSLELERKFADYLGVEHCLSVTSGTAALHSAYFGLGLEPGDEVLAPTYTFFATVMPLFAVNAIPVLVDADASTGNLDPAQIERHITEKTRAIVVTHLWGNPVDMDAVMEIARRRGLRVVEDCSHAHGASCNGRLVGTFGDVAVFSLQGKKLVAAGQGGVLVTNDDEVFERAVLLGHFNIRAFQDVHSPTYRPYAYTGFGLNYRMHPLAAAIANRQMDRLESYISGRRANLEYLSARLAEIPGVEPPAAGLHVTRQVYYSYKPTYRPEDLDGLPIVVYVDALRAEGVPIDRYDAPPLHVTEMFRGDQPPFVSHGVPEAFARGGRRRSYRPGDFPAAEDYAARLLALPAYTDPVRGALDAFAAAFAKVADHADELREHAARAGPQ
jgi:perosamine synthetase